MMMYEEIENMVGVIGGRGVLLGGKWGSYMDIEFAGRTTR